MASFYLFKEYFLNGLKNIFSNRWRSFFTISGIALGAAATLVLSGLSLNFTKATLQNLEELGGARLTVLIPGGQIYSDTLLLNSLKPLKPLVEEIAAFLEFESFWPEGNLKILVRGVTEEFFQINHFKISGRFFSASDFGSQKFVCLLEKNTPGTLPFSLRIGERLRIENYYFPIIGQVFKQTPDFLETGLIVYLPLKLAKTLFPAGNLGCVLKIGDIKNVEFVEKKIKTILPASPGLEVISFSGLRKAISEFNQTAGQLLIFIILLTILIGGLGVANVMLINIIEKTYEFGLRLALGTAPFKIFTQVLVESVLFSLLGVGLGLGGGLIFDILISLILKLPFIFPQKTACLIVASGLFFGFLFGLYPALKAGAADPIEAIRQ